MDTETIPAPTPAASSSPAEPKIEAPAVPAVPSKTAAPATPPEPAAGPPADVLAEREACAKTVEALAIHARFAECRCAFCGTLRNAAAAIRKRSSIVQQ